jgi:uncharacterized protein YdhG (YjbR/CyaY superfamily)
MDKTVKAYIDAIAPEQRALFDRIHKLILKTRPDVEVVVSYKIPTYKVGRRRLYVAAWKHGVSIYGWDQGRDAGFVARHKKLVGAKGTIKLRASDLAGIPDDELRDLVRHALEA